MPPVWITALSVTLLMQTVASLLTQSLSVLAPLITASAGLAPESIGNLSALVAGGTMLFLLFGGPFLARWGPVRTLQAGALVAAFAMLVAATGTAPALVVASLLLGVGYGPSPPAGSRILATTAPPGRRTLIFSVKQAGAPLGGALAGVLIAPLAAAYGWSVAALAAIAVAIIAAAVIQPLQSVLDTERNPAQSLRPGAILDRRTWTAPVAALRLHPALWPLTLLAMSFAVLQGCLFAFAVTWLIARHGLTLVQAGTAFACMQAAGVMARIVLGWLADRTGSPSRNLLAQAFVAAFVALGYAIAPLGASLAFACAASALVGFFAASWNGVYLAEVARLVAPADVAAATSGSTLFTFVGYLAGPPLFSLIVAGTGSWDAAYLAASGQLALVALAVTVALRRTVRG